MKSNKTPYIPSVIGVLCGLLLAFWAFSEALNLVALFGLALAGYNVFRMVRLFRRPPAESDPLYRAGDDEHSATMRKIQGAARLWRGLFWLATAAAVVVWVVAFATGGYAAAVAVSLVALVFRWIAEHYKEKGTGYVAENITRDALAEVFTVTEYHPSGHPPASMLRGTDVGFFPFDDCEGRDYMQGSYRGMRVEMCDLHLFNRNTRLLEDGRTEEYTSTVFKGLFLCLDRGRASAADLRIRERGSMGKVFGGKGIQTANEAFNRRFCVESESVSEAQRTLSPRLLEAILAMDDHVGGKTCIRVERSGRICLSISRDADFFAVGKNDGDATLLRRRFVESLRDLTDCLDALTDADGRLEGQADALSDMSKS